jgi:hypothetical protein
MRFAFILAALVLCAAAPVRAADATLDLGFAHAGMTLDEFRDGGWPGGAAVLCSGDAGIPDDAPQVDFSVPKGVAQLGGLRCGVFSPARHGWRPHAIDLAGTPTEVWGLFFPDPGGTPRLLQLLLKQSSESFAALADYFTARFGPARVRGHGLAHWDTAEADAAIIEDGGKRLHAYLIDNRLQAALNARMSQHPRPRDDKKDEHP